MSAPRENGLRRQQIDHSKKEVKLRKFGINENYQMAMYVLDQYRGTALSCRYSIPPRLASEEGRAQLEEQVKFATVGTIMRHPMLQVGMRDATSKTPSWIQLESLDLANHIKWQPVESQDGFEETVQAIFRTQLDERFPELAIKQPDWKLTILRQGNAPVMEVLLTWNHPQFDGAGAKVFHEDFLELLNAENGASEPAGLSGDTLLLPKAPPMLPAPIESLTSLPVDLKYLVKALWEDTRPQVLNRDISQAIWCPIRTVPYKTQFRHFDVDGASVQAIQSLCRQKKTTMTGLLNALALIAFSLRLDRSLAPAFQSSTIIDHRRNLPPAPSDAPWLRSDRAVGNFVTQLPHKYETDLVARIRSKLPADTTGEISLSADLQRELWDAAAQSRLEIVKKLEKPLRNDIVGLFKYVTDWKQTMSDMAKKKRQFTWLVTNIGVMDGRKVPTPSAVTTKSPTGADMETVNDQKWSICRAQFGLSAEVPAAAIELASVSVSGHGMCVTANWADCAVDVKLGERIMADLEGWLAQLANLR